jgi:hypothetical protein
MQINGKYACAAVLAIAAGFGVAVPGAQAQEAPPHSELIITPYLWVPGIDGNLGAAADIPPVPVHADFPGVFNHLEGAGMISGEFRYGSFGVLGDYFWLTISGDHSVTFNHLPVLSGNIKLTTNDGTVAGFWRAYQDERYTFDVLAGARYTAAKSSVSINLGDRGVSGTAKIDGWDPIVGVRGSMRTGQKGSLSGYADFGGGSFADTVWQVLGTYNYGFTGHFAGRVGWRVYGVNLSRGSNDYDITASGPLVGATFRFY